MGRQLWEKLSVRLQIHVPSCQTTWSAAIANTPSTPQAGSLHLSQTKAWQPWCWPRSSEHVLRTGWSCLPKLLLFFELQWQLMFNDCFFSLIQLNPLKNIQGLHIGWLVVNWWARSRLAGGPLGRPDVLVNWWARSRLAGGPLGRSDVLAGGPSGKIPYTLDSRPYAKGPVPKVLVLEKQCIKHKPWFICHWTIQNRTTIASPDISKYSGCWPTTFTHIKFD